MKLLTIFILFSMVTASANSYSQQTKFKFSLRNATVRSVFQEIEENSEFILLYDEKNVDVNRIVTINVNDESVNSILDQVFEGTGNTYKIFDRQIVILGTNDIEIPVFLNQPRQPSKISGKVMDSSGSPLPGVSVAIKGTTQGTITNTEGSYSLPNVPGNGTLMFSFVGMKPHEVRLEGKTTVNVVMEEQTVGIEEVIAVGYGTQKKMDITGSVASVQQERLEMVPNTNIAQAIQGAIPGVMMQTSSAGAVSEQTIMIRGRNSILADNSPLVVVDGIPYYGSWKDLNPNDVKSIEVLKDASAAAIYGSRGANGVILITTEAGKEGKPKISYDGYYSVQSFVKLPDLMNGEEFYNFKKERSPGSITPSEQEIYDSGQWTDWLDLAMRNANSTEHNLSVSGGFQNTNYYISGGVLKVRGLALNDDYLRLTSRMNLDTQIAGWLTIGTRTQLSYDDRGGNSPTWEGDTGSVFSMNPLTRAYDENGKLMIRTWPEEPTFPNPLQATLAINTSETYQVISNNYAIVKFPFIPGLQYRINAGLRVRFDETNTYYGRDTKTGLDVGGRASSGRDRANNNVIENIVEYNHDFGKHNLFFTGVYSYESNKSNDLSTSAKGFPHDLLTWYSVAQAEVKEFDYSYNKTILLSQMLRLNYSYDSRYLLTLTGRRDGYSGFGAKTKWGVFPSMALGWNLAKENFFPWKNIVNDLKWRVSYGLNGNQAVGAYQTISRLGQSNYITGTSTLPGYVPSKLGMDDLGWESSKTFNLGFDFGLLENRVIGDLNYYRTNTFDLLLNRTISPIHGITSITQNIGKTRNNGWEASVTSRNIVKPNFQWRTSANISWTKNKIVSLYGELDDEGKEIDDVANRWFIGKPIRVNYGYVWEGVWQLDEAEEAAKYGTEPGFIKVQDVNDDDQITVADCQIIGQTDPKWLWGLTNTWSYKNFTLSVFVHGVHGAIKSNSYLLDDSGTGVETRRNITNKDFWTPENPNASHPINREQNWQQQGHTPMTLENAGFVRVKDITLSYDLPKHTLNQLGFSQVRIYVTGRNQFTFTKWKGLDPELSGQINVPLQKELVFGLNLGF